MSIKTFNIDNEVYDKFSGYCKENGISMSRQVQFFMQSVTEEEPETRREYIEKLNRIRNGRFIKVESFAKRYGLK